MKSTILIVDDSVINSKLLSKIVMANGHQAHAVNSGIDALKYLITSRPEVILMDIKMPVMNGFECYKRIKRSVSRAKIPVIFVTGSHDKLDEKMAKSMGAKGYFTKPVNANELLSEIEFNLPFS